MLMTPFDLEITWAFPGKHVAATPVDAHPPALVLTFPAEPPVAAQLVAEPACETISMMKDSKRIRLMIFGFIFVFNNCKNTHNN